VLERLEEVEGNEKVEKKCELFHNYGITVLCEGL